MRSRRLLSRNDFELALIGCIALSVIDALQVSDDTYDMIHIFFSYYILIFYHFMLFIAYMHIYCDVSGFVQ